MILNEAPVSRIHQEVGVFARQKRTSVRTLSWANLLTIQAVVQFNTPGFTLSSLCPFKLFLSYNLNLYLQFQVNRLPAFEFCLLAVESQSFYFYRCLLLKG